MDARSAIASVSAVISRQYRSFLRTKLLGDCIYSSSNTADFRLDASAPHYASCFFLIISDFRNNEYNLIYDRL